MLHLKSLLAAPHTVNDSMPPVVAEEKLKILYGVTGRLRLLARIDIIKGRQEITSMFYVLCTEPKIGVYFGVYFILLFFIYL